jgi:hypothetical protein
MSVQTRESPVKASRPSAKSGASVGSFPTRAQPPIAAFPLRTVPPQSKTAVMQRGGVFSSQSAPVSDLLDVAKAAPLHTAVPSNDNTASRPILHAAVISRPRVPSVNYDSTEALQRPFTPDTATSRSASASLTASMLANPACSRSADGDIQSVRSKSSLVAPIVVDPRLRPVATVPNAAAACVRPNYPLTSPIYTGQASAAAGDQAANVSAAQKGSRTIKHLYDPVCF